MRYAFLLLALAWPAIFVAPAAGQDPSDLTFEGEVAQSEIVTPEGRAAAGPGFIRITLTPAMDGVLRAEVVEMVLRNSHMSYDLVQSAERYYWPPLPIEDGRFELTLPTVEFGSLRTHVEIQGEVLSSSELDGTIEPSHFGPITTWSASGPADTPPGPQDQIFDAFVEGGGTVSVALTEEGMGVTSFDLKDLPLDACFPGETLSVRPIFEPGVGLDRAGALFTGESITRSVSLTVAEVDGSQASGTLYWSSGMYTGDCRFEVDWQTEPFPTTTATAKPIATPIPTPVAPIELPPAGSGGARGVPSAGFAILVACVGAALATAGLFKLRAGH